MAEATVVGLHHPPSTGDEEMSRHVFEAEVADDDEVVEVVAVVESQ
jgi:hypothetical protein